VRALKDIEWMVPDDMPPFNLTGTLAQYRDMYRMEKALEEAA
jgi:hypothetical protein